MIKKNTLLIQLLDILRQEKDVRLESSDNFTTNNFANVALQKSIKTQVKLHLKHGSIRFSFYIHYAYY